MGFLKLMKSTSYAFHVIYYMAQQPLNENPIQLKILAKALDLPENYLSKVLQTLNKANIINSFRGAKRGYKLAKKPEDITFLEIIETFEGPVNGNLCLLDLDSCIFGECVLNGAINNLTDSVKSILSKTTIKEEFGV
ncbi:MAG: hypothetical protein BA866_06895 [Desulfobulbaceae bacterium S5133MH15]|nr:MAG: hypothetical protein BA866_06895 [Desulfobulbaceae bacterium S5133MH15]